MANLFIGFPVPRARIADMITGEAAPKDHHTDHEDGGSDEVDCTGLEGAGGLTLPLEDFFFLTHFESLDGFLIETTGGGFVTINNHQVQVNTSITTNSHAKVTKKRTYTTVDLSWNKERIFKTRVQLRASTNNIGTLKVISGSSADVRGIGFKVVDGVLYGLCRTISSETTLTIETLGAGSFNEVRNLKCHLKPGNEVRFFVDGIDKGAISSGLPTGVGGAKGIMFLSVENPGVSSNRTITISEYQVWQEA